MTTKAEIFGPDERRELDIAIAEDSGFVSAIMARMRIAERESDWGVLQRLEIFGECHALAIVFETFLIYRFKSEEHGI